MTPFTQLKAAALFERMDALELTVCQVVNRGSERAPLRALFRAVSRLGDGLIWYVLLALIPVVYGMDSVGAAVHIGITALAGVLVYKFLKGRLVRERPHVSSTRIRLAAPALDRYSFPSGHTLHAVSFTLMGAHYFPETVYILAPFALLAACSRVILGLHYPSDVLAGAAIGWLLARASLGIVAL